MNTAIRAASSSVFGLIGLGALLFLPAGTLNYWQAWVFIATTLAATIVPALYIARTDPAALQRRMHAGPTAETRGIQKIAIVGAMLTILLMLTVIPYDHRMGWSHPADWVCLLGDLLVASGLGIAMLVIIQNGYAAATVTVETGQHVVAGGLYRLVRHPMYVGNVIMMIGVPPALGSYWGLVLVIPGVVVLVVRIRDEERLLVEQLAGYREYTQQVRYRLLPYVW